MRRLENLPRANTRAAAAGDTSDIAAADMATTELAAAEDEPGNGDRRDDRRGDEP
jgi:hypothetical protein